MYFYGVWRVGGVLAVSRYVAADCSLPGLVCVEIGPRNPKPAGLVMGFTTYSCAACTVVIVHPCGGTALDGCMCTCAAARCAPVVDSPVCAPLPVVRQRDR